ncbi:hypothetical protein [Actinacidiphila soli]|uniref:hypothetical protein n=1 Tax=Actinacidiphila soli TaxID=2487275 RepID=UPI000FCAC075|nr:hypothetical protein [Actinacidiphila soli]
METTKTAEAAESATETEIDAKAAEVEPDNNLLVEDETKTENDSDTDSEIDADDADFIASYDDGSEPVAASTGVLAGAGAVIGAGLGLSSLTGTWIGTLMSDRQQLIGQINSSSAATATQIAQIYGSPWHTVALFNGLFGLAAIIVAGVVLLTAKSAAPWTRAVAWGGLALGVLGLFIAGVMWFDVFTDLPQVAATTTSSTTG